MTPLPKALQRFLEAFCALDTDAYVGAFAEDFVLLDPSGRTDTRDGLVGHMTVSRANWSRINYRIDALLQSGDTLALNYAVIMTGREGAPWAGQTIEMKCMVFAEIEHDLIKRWDETFDTAVLRRAAKRG